MAKKNGETWQNDVLRYTKKKFGPQGQYEFSKERMQMTLEVKQVTQACCVCQETQGIKTGRLSGDLK